MRQLSIFIIVVSIIIISPLFCQEKITEKVKIDWWVLPLFAVDKDGNSVGDLKPEDIDLQVNNHRITGFTLYKRTFSIEEKAAETGDKAPLPQVDKSKIVFLLFDLAFSTNTNYKQAKEIAKNMVQKADKATLFAVIAIDPLSGPVYLGGPLADKQKVIKLIDEKIGWNPTTKSINLVLSMVYGSQVVGEDVGKEGGSHERLDTRDIGFLAEQRSSGFRKSNMNYYSAFQTLYHALNSIKDNKFIYLFSEGISLFARSVLAHGQEEYWYFMKQTAGYLGKSGAVLFIINPAGAELNARSIASGEDSLRYLAKESGGKYIEGEQKTISRRIENMYRAYYEIAFPDQESFKGKTRDITIKSKRKGISIHTLRKLEKSKMYSEMQEIEKEILVLNLISQNPLYETNIKSKGVKVLKKTQSKGKITYNINIPKEYLKKEIDLFKVMTDKKNSETKIKKEKIIPQKRKFNVQFAAPENTDTHFVLLNGTAGTALIEGPGIYDDLDYIEPTAKGKALSDDPKFKQVMEKYLTGAAEYCKDLKEAAFHCYCKENVAETYSFIRNLGRFNQAANTTDISLYENRATTEDIARRNEASTRSNFWKMVRKYVFDYQIISDAGRVKEQRKLISSSTPETLMTNDRVARMLYSFLTERVVFGPVTLLAADQQEKFNFRLMKFEKQDGRHFAVVEALPRVKKEPVFAFGKVWIDTEDYSIRKIQLDPRAIHGYEHLLKEAKRLRTRLYLDCEIEYDKIHNGIRFPTKVTLSENYKGGPIIIRVIGNKTWERSKKSISYTDYKFFDVQTKVESTKVDKN